jgi:hypothetical protein
MLWELYMRRQAFNPHQTYAGFKHKICDLRERPPIPDNCPAVLAHLIRCCWDHYPGMKRIYNVAVRVVRAVLSCHEPKV